MPSSERGVSTPFKILQWIVTYFAPIGALLVVGLGAWGYSSCTKGLAPSDAIYRALQFFALGATPTECTVTPWNLQIARFLAAFLIFLAVIALFFLPVWTAFKCWFQAIFRGQERHILIGYGAINQEIARVLSAQGKPMTIVARARNSAMRDFAVHAPVAMIERDIRNEGALNGLYLHRAKRIIIACGDDALTLEVAQRISIFLETRKAERKQGRANKLPNWLRWLSPCHLSPEEVIHAHFKSTAMQRHLLLARDLGLAREKRFSGFSIRVAAARFLFARAWLVERASLATPRHTRLHVVIMGAGDLGMAVAREAIQHGCSAGLAAPLVSVIDQDSAAAERRFRSDMPRLFDATIPSGDRPEFRFLECTAEAFEGHQLGSDDPVTAWVICCPEDAVNLTLAMKLEQAMRRGQLGTAPIYPRQWQGNIRGNARLGLGQEDPLHLTAPFGGMQDIVPTLEFLDQRLLGLAKAIHAEYQVTDATLSSGSPFAEVLTKHGLPPWQDDQGPQDAKLRQQIQDAVDNDRQRFRGAWETLSTDAKLSNLASAQQAALRLWELGFDWKGRHMGVMPRILGTYIDTRIGQSAAPDLAEDSLVGGIAAAEHRRWMTERALHGWAAAKPNQRENGLRLHPNFDNYEVLGEQAKTKDRDTREQDASTVRGILRNLSLLDEGPLARLPGDVPPLALSDVNMVPKNVARLTIMIKDDDASRLEKGLKQLAIWMALQTSLSIRLILENPVVLETASLALRDSLLSLRETALRHQIHVWTEFSGARKLRARVARYDVTACEDQQTDG